MSLVVNVRVNYQLKKTNDTNIKINNQLHIFIQNLHILIPQRVKDLNVDYKAVLCTLIVKECARSF